MKKYICKENMCTGCKACIDKCSKDAIYIQDELDRINAIIDLNKCIECGACYEVCPNNTLVELREQLSWYQGWTKSFKERESSSSGGFAATLAKKFIKEKGIVCSCVFEKGDFRFKVAETEEDVEYFKGSKYVKSNPEGIYKKIKIYLKENKKVLFIGLPCQVAAVKSFIGKKLDQNLYTVDLICHGTPSVKLLDNYLQQYNIKLSDVKKISFRTKNSFNMRRDDRTIIDSRIQDIYTMTFLSSLNYTENCYFCRYATEKRIGDITIGDSWGSKLNNDEIDKGISLILCQTKKGKELLENLEFFYKKVILKTAIENNHQLNHPAKMPLKREQFFRGIKKGKKYNFVVAKIYPKTYLKREIKKILYKIMGGREEVYRIIVWK